MWLHQWCVSEGCAGWNVLSHHVAPRMRPPCSGDGGVQMWLGCLCMQANENGLDEGEVKRRIEQYGYNKLPESTRIPFLVRHPFFPHTA